jgi:AcrR family transcriptional regulator
MLPKDRAHPRARAALRKPPQRESIRLSREQRATEILVHARAVFCEMGYADALVSEIAERAGVVEGSVFHYFPTKRELLIRAVEQWYEVLISGYDKQLDTIAGTWNRLRFMIWGHLNIIHEEPEIVKLIINEIRPRPEYRETSIFALNRDYTRRTLAIVEEGIASGEFRADCPGSVVRSMIYGGVEHYAFAFLRGEGDFSPSEAADAITHLIYRGLANDGVAQAAMLHDPISRIESGLAALKKIADPGAAA